MSEPAGTRACPFCEKTTRANRHVCDHCNRRISEQTPDDRRAEWAGFAFAISFGLTWLIGGATCAMHNNPDGTVPWMRQHGEAIIFGLWGLTMVTGLLWFWLQRLAKF